MLKRYFSLLAWLEHATRAENNAAVTNLIYTSLVSLFCHRFMLRSNDC
jgi:hypothetical protein